MRRVPESPVERPFGTLREQVSMQQEWLQKRLDTFLPGLLRKHGIDLWLVPMREYNEDPVFLAITSPQTFAARRRTIYVFFDTCELIAARLPEEEVFPRWTCSAGAGPPKSWAATR